MEAFPLIDIAGSATERGIEHGRQAKARIARGLEIDADALARPGARELSLL